MKINNEEGAQAPPLQTGELENSTLAGVAILARLIVCVAAIPFLLGGVLLVVTGNMIVLPAIPVTILIFHYALHIAMPKSITPNALTVFTATGSKTLQFADMKYFLITNLNPITYSNCGIIIKMKNRFEYYQVHCDNKNNLYQTLKDLGIKEKSMFFKLHSNKKS